MTSDEAVDRAHRLLADRDALQPWRTFVPHAGMTLDSAYDLQDAVARLRERRGELVIGYKVGCTSAAVREQLGIREPIFARIFETDAFPPASRVSHARFANLAIEGELALRLARDLPARSATDVEYVDAIEAIFPVIELHHHVLPTGASAAPALIACGGMHAGFVPTDSVDAIRRGWVPESVALKVAIDGRVVGATSEPWTMGHPVATLRWLSARLADRGLTLRRGDLILTGSALPLYPLGPACHVEVEARPLGRCSLAIE